MKSNTWIAVTIGSALALVGCGPVEPPKEVSEAKTKFEDARKSVDEAAQRAKAAEDAMRKMVDRANQAIADGKAQIERMKKATTLDDQAKKYITDTLADAEVAVQQHALPAIQEAWRKFPDQRVWLEGRMKEQIDRASGEMKGQWEEALANLKAQ